MAAIVVKGDTFGLHNCLAIWRVRATDEGIGETSRCFKAKCNVWVDEKQQGETYAILFIRAWHPRKRIRDPGR